MTAQRVSRRVPAARIKSANHEPAVPAGDYVLYWMTAHRRIRWNFSLQRAAEWCRELGKPLLVLEAVRCDYPWASDRFHRFLLAGMIENGRCLRRYGICYFPYIEKAAGNGKGLLRQLAQKACVVIGDDYPAFFYPRMLQAASRSLPVRVELVDSNGIFPMRDTDRVFTTAFSFRAFLQKTLRPHLYAFPDPDPLAGMKNNPPYRLPGSILRRWPRWECDRIEELNRVVKRLPIDHSVGPALQEGGSDAARLTLKNFIRGKLDLYSRQRNEPDEDATSGLSPYLHFGHISSHEVFHEVMNHAGWSIDALGAATSGKRSGWWGVSESAEAFLDQLVTWRELGFNMCSHSEAYDRFTSLPSWAQATLADHAADPRDPCYSLDDFESARTHDPLWNAAQIQLLREGRIHNYLRMLWGKKILEWSPDPEEALRIMIELNNRYALDGRDPNSYSGIFWILGRYDRPWGPERPVFGHVRYMSSANTARKLNVSRYIARYRH